MTWGDLFDATADVEVTVEKIRATLAAHRGEPADAGERDDA